MVKILKNRKYDIWGLYDPKKNVLIKWTKGWQADWEGKNETFAFSIKTGTMVDGVDFHEHTEQKIIDELKELDVTKGELPISYDESYEDTEYTDRETNDACRVPDFDWCNYYFKYDNADDGKILCLSFENHSTPWFTGDCYEMSDDEWHQWDDSKAEFVECTSGELVDFKSKFIDAVIKDIEHSIEKTAKKAIKESKAIEKAYAGLADQSLRVIVEKHYGNKKPPKEVIEIANEVFAFSKK